MDDGARERYCEQRSLAAGRLVLASIAKGHCSHDINRTRSCSVSPVPSFVRICCENLAWSERTSNASSVFSPPVPRLCAPAYPRWSRRQSSGDGSGYRVSDDLSGAPPGAHRRWRAGLASTARAPASWPTLAAVSGSWKKCSPRLVLPHRCSRTRGFAQEAVPGRRGPGRAGHQSPGRLPRAVRYRPRMPSTPRRGDGPAGDPTRDARRDDREHPLPLSRPLWRPSRARQTSLRSGLQSRSGLGGARSGRRAVAMTLASTHVSSSAGRSR